ncbi:MAG: prenyltransferase [Rhodospirillaceae bacterium]|nr:prenyltransferase [Rhodospirillaceae bacterium]
MGEPNPTQLCQPGVAPMLRRWALATRPAFLSASIIPVLAGSAWGYGQTGSFDLYLFLLALAATALAHGGINVLNDVHDHKNGTDRINDARIFPFTGGSRFIQNEIMNISQMARLGWTLLMLSLVLGLWLATLKGWAVIAMGAGGVMLGVAYSVPPLALSTRGLGELAVGVGFGPLPVMGAAWLQGSGTNLEGFVFSVIIGLWVALILIVNEVPDMAADAKAAKRTLAVRLGHKNTAILYLGLHLLAFLLIGFMVYQQFLPGAALLLPLLMLGASIRAAFIIRRPADTKKMLVAIKTTLAIHAIGSLWLGLFAAV